MERYRIHVKLRLLYKVKSLAREQLHGGFAEFYPAAHEAKKRKSHKNNKRSLCKELGHNAVTCKAKKVSPKKAAHVGDVASSSQQGNTRGRERLLLSIV